MPKIYLKTQHGTQEGYNNTGANYIASGWNYGLTTSRVGLVRFSHVPIPKGSTINSAVLHMVYSVKNGNQAYSFSSTPWVHDTSFSPWMSDTRNEWETNSHVQAGSTTHNFSWLIEGSGGYRNRQLASYNVKTMVQYLVNKTDWTLAGGPMRFLMTFSSISSPDNIYFHRREEGWPPVLEIDYTLPASDGKEFVVNQQENATFTGAFPWNGQPAGLEANAPYAFNNWFGAFVQPTYVINAAGGPAAPKGGNVLRVASAGTGTMRSMVHFGVPNLEDGVWYNYSCYVYVPSGSPDIQLVSLGDRTERLSSFATMTEKDQWKRQEFSFIGHGNSGQWGAVQQVSGGPAYSAGSVFYIANVQLTKGRQLKPYIDGSQTLANATYGWAGQTGTNGFVRAAAPSVTINNINDVGRKKYFGISWNYTNSAGHAQYQAEVQIRRTKF